jgi:hypothetical protein
VSAGHHHRQVPAGLGAARNRFDPQYSRMTTGRLARPVSFGGLAARRPGASAARMQVPRDRRCEPYARRPSPRVLRTRRHGDRPASCNSIEHRTTGRAGWARRERLSGSIGCRWTVRKKGPPRRIALDATISVAAKFRKWPFSRRDAVSKQRGETASCDRPEVLCEDSHDAGTPIAQ